MTDILDKVMTDNDNVYQNLLTQVDAHSDPELLDAVKNIRCQLNNLTLVIATYVSIADYIKGEENG